jgi:asparagine synthase (glutamine-hydrolysing)
MCGIFSILSINDIDIKLVEKYFKYSSKRGPEFSKLTFYEKVCLGFHRLAINGLDEISNQPFESDDLSLICNGEIYNHKQLMKQFNIKPNTNSDCEVIMHAYRLIGHQCFNLLDGVYSCILFDKLNGQLIVSRDYHGVRPLYVCHYNNGNIGFSSDIKPLLFDKNIKNLNQLEPGSLQIYDINTLECLRNEKFFNKECLKHELELSEEYYMKKALTLLQNGIKKRVENCERDIACLLSGGLDSSIISAYVSRFYKEKCGKQIETYSIGLEDGEDLKYSEMVAKHINSMHKTVVYSNEKMIETIPDVIKDIESYDTTTVRASVGNWNIGKYIKENSNAKVIFNGDGSDELMGGYMYFHCCKTDEDFHKENIRLLDDISKFDVLRSDKSISSHGLEPRTPFLDKEFTLFYLSIPIKYRNHNNKKKCEKYFIRKAIELYDPDLLPKEVLWRKKEAFSDGISSLKKSWYEIIQEKLEKDNIIMNNDKYNYNKPSTKEQYYYRELFHKEFGNNAQVIPYFWMPKFIENPTDSSARTLNIYNQT